MSGLVFDEGAVGRIADKVSGSGDDLSALTLSAQAGGADLGSPAVSSALEGTISIQSAMLHSIGASASALGSGVRATVKSFSDADEALAKKAQG